MNATDLLIEDTFNFIFKKPLINEHLGNVIATAVRGAFRSGTPEEKEKRKFLDIIETYVYKVTKVLKNMVAFAKNPKNNTPETRPIGQAVEEKAEVLEVLMTTLYNSPFGKELTKHVDFSKIDVEIDPSKLKSTRRPGKGVPNVVPQPPIVGKNAYFTYDAERKIAPDTNKNKSWNTTSWGWTETANRNTGTLAPSKMMTLSQLFSYAASGEQTFRIRKEVENDKNNRAILPDENGTVNKDIKHQRELYNKHLKEWTDKINDILADFNRDLDRLNYDMTRFPDIQNIVSTFKAQCTIFKSTRKTNPSTRGQSITFATANHVDRKGEIAHPQRLRSKVSSVIDETGNEETNLYKAIFDPNSPPEHVRTVYKQILQTINMTPESFERWLNLHKYPRITRRLKPLRVYGDNTQLLDKDKEKLVELLSRLGIDLTPPR